MTDPAVKLFAEEVVDELEKRSNDGERLETVRVAPFVYRVLDRTLKDSARGTSIPDSAGMVVHGVAVEIDEELTAFEFGSGGRRD